MDGDDDVDLVGTMRPWWWRWGERAWARLEAVKPRPYAVTRWLVLRLLGVVYAFAFAGVLLQQGPLLGSHGLTPIARYVERLHAGGFGVADVPSIFMVDPSDRAMTVVAVIGFVLALALALGYANLPSVLALWVLYGSYERVGQLWFGFGWEIQLLETTLIAACLVHPWDPRPLRAPQPPATAIVLMRWLAFRIFLGAGLIKLRGSACWTELTCLDAHFETQPIPNPLSTWFHFLPHWVHAVGVVFNHVVELALPLLVFGPRRLRLVAAFGMLAFQVTLIASGNLAFLNWLTVIPILAVFDDDAVLWFVPRRIATWLRARGDRPAPEASLGILVAAIGAGAAAALLGALWWALGVVGAIGAFVGFAFARAGSKWQLAVGLFAGMVAMKSCAVVENLASDEQAMNRSYDRFATVNTYGAFGSVDFDRHELVIEGTLDDDPAHATWRAYELPCKPGDPARRPCVLGPYHLRFDWLIWFAAMSPEIDDSSAWLLHVVWKLLDGDVGVRAMFATDPFAGRAPKWVRIQRWAYHLAPYSAPTWWTRDDEQPWLPPLSLDSDGFADILARKGWPSPTRK